MLCECIVSNVVKSCCISLSSLGLSGQSKQSGGSREADSRGITVASGGGCEGRCGEQRHQQVRKSSEAALINSDLH